MTIAGLPDYEARRAIREDLDATLVVEAAAGTGKTTELVQRVVAVLESGRATIDSLVAVTFTEKAAGEMKLRLRAELERALGRSEGGPRARLSEAILGLEGARIGTLHGFCHDLLRERPVEAGVDPGFEMLDDAAAQRLFARVFDDWLEQSLQHPPEGLRRVLRRASGQGAGLRSSLRRAAWGLVETRDFPAPYRRDPFDRAARLDAVFESLEKLGALAAQARDPNDYLARALTRAQSLVNRVHRREEVAERDYDGLEADLRELTRYKHAVFRWKGSPRSQWEDISRDAVLAQRDALKAELDAVLEACEAELAACLHAELWPLTERYEQAKAAQGGLDFFDLLLCTRDLLREHGGVRRELCERFSHLFLDEFQDTDPVQTEIALLLASDDPGEHRPWQCAPAAGKLFLVGDPKQSIYRFRRADPRFYVRVRDHLVQRGARVVALSTSFRALPDVQHLVNASFASRMQPGDAGAAGYVPLSPFREPRADQPAVVALPVPQPYADYGKLANRAIEASLPDAVGAFVHWLVTDSGYRVREGDADVALAARHVCLLFKQTSSFGTDVVRDYVRALEARHVPHARAGGRSFHAREEVLALRTALEAIEWPDDALAVYATLRGPLFALGDDHLLRYRSEVGALHPLAPVELDALETPLREVAEALAVLGRLHASRNRRPVHHTLRGLLTETRAHAAFAIWPTGEQALGNVLRLGELARRYEGLGEASSFRGFVDWLSGQADEGESEEAAVVEEGDDGVRLLTVHGAKGLEFPVVILCHPTAPLRPSHPSRYIDVERALWARSLMWLSPVELNEHADEVLDEDEAEVVRLGYVAATRAREMLVVPVVGDHSLEEAAGSGWTGVFAEALFPAPESRRQPQPAPGCPAFGDDSVYARPERAHKGARASVAPGLHVPSRGAHRVIFWDPSCLDLGARAPGGLRQQELLIEDEAGAGSARLEAFEHWRGERARVIAQASAARIPAAPVTALAALRSEAPREVTIETCERVAGRPGGKRFGSLVHALLEQVAPGDDASTRAGLARALARTLGADDAEREAALHALDVALRHPLMQRAFAAAARGEMFREAPLSVRAEDGSVMEGVVDLAFREQGTTWIVDYKTDRDGADNPQYHQQLSLYAEALEALTGEPARCVLLVV